MTEKKPPRIVTLLTDFGPGSLYVGQMHAVLVRRAPDAHVLDLAHDVPPGEIRAAAYVLERSYPLCPPGSVHVVVVDPGVGTERAILASGARLVGWVGSEVDPATKQLAANIDTLRDRLASPCLGIVRHPSSRTPDIAAVPLDVKPLIPSNDR